MLPGPLSPAVHPLGEGHSPADVTPPEVVVVSTPKGPVSIAWEAGTSSSYSYHSFLIGGLRLPLDVEARPGNESHGVHGAEALWHLLDHRLPAAGQPWCIRGDISYGNETIIAGCEARRRDFLFTLRRSHGIKAIIDAPDTGDHNRR
jgi:hypothetical protein